MSLSRIRPSTIAIAVAAGLTVLVGTYTENEGFQLAGALFAVVAVVMAINQARSASGPSQGASE
jgi:hypothetical protein